MNTLTKLLTGVLLAGFAAQAPAGADTLRIGYQNEPDPSHVAIVDAGRGWLRPNSLRRRRAWVL